MSVENSLKLLGVSEGASFDDILRPKKTILAYCKDDPETVAQVEAAYGMLLMQSLTQRRAGKVVNNSVRYAMLNRLILLERECFRKICLKMDAVLELGRRGVFEGVIEGLHQHWKHKELVKLISMQRTFLQVFYTAGNREWWFDSMH